MSFPMTRDALKASAPAPPAPTPVPAPVPAPVKPLALTQAQIDANKAFVSSRVNSLSSMMVTMAKAGKKSHVVTIVRKPLLADIVAGLKVNFPDSKFEVDEEKGTVNVDWS